MRPRMVTGFGGSNTRIPDVEDVSKRPRTGSKIEGIDQEAGMQGRIAVQFHPKPSAASGDTPPRSAACTRKHADLAGTLRYDARRRIAGRAGSTRPSLRWPMHACPSWMRVRATRSPQDAAT